MHHYSADKTYALFLNPANRKIISDLELSGAKTVLLPTLETREIAGRTDNPPPLLKNFDWLIFTDIYTVEFFLQKLQEDGFDFFDLDEFRICAYGESVADRLRFVQLHSDIVPNRIKTSEVLQAIRDYFGEESNLKNTRFLILKEKKLLSEIAKELKKIGAVAVEFPIYEITAENESEIAKLKSLLIGGAIDEFIFTSPFDVVNLAHLFPNENLPDILNEIRLTAVNKTVLQSLEEFRIIV